MSDYVIDPGPRVALVAAVARGDRLEARIADLPPLVVQAT